MTETVGTYRDGLSPRPQPVRVVLGPQSLHISGADGSPIAEWLYTELHRLDSRDGLRLAISYAEGPRLEIVDHAFATALASCSPRLRRSRHPGRTTTIAVLAGTLALLAAAYAALPLMAEPLARLLPDSFHQRFGAFAAKAVQGDSRLCTGDGLAALERLADRLVPPDERRHRLVLAVVDDPMVNAFSTGGGHVVVMRGLLAEAQSPDEVAGVLAHELAHERLGHVGQRMVRHMGLAVLVTVATGDSSGSLAGIASAAVELSYGRADEAAADDGAVNMLRQAGISTGGLASFFERLENKHPEGRGALALLSTHPPSAERALSVGVHDGRPGLSKAEWAAVKGLCK